MLSFSGAVSITARTVTETLEDAVDWHCGKCGDQRDRDRSGLTLWQVWRPRRQRQKWTDTVASEETNATETEVDWHCGKCGDQGNRQKWTDTVASVETKATGTEVGWHCGKCGDQRDRQKWTDTVASVETNTTGTEVGWHCVKRGDQGDRDRSGLTLWQVWRPTRQIQKVKLKQEPALLFERPARRWVHS